MTSSTDIAVERHGSSVTARLSGEVDITNAGLVGDQLGDSIGNDATALVVDLTEARYLDSAAIAVLFDLARRLHRRRQALRLVLPAGSPLQRLLAITEVQEVASVHESIEEALAAE